MNDHAAGEYECAVGERPRGIEDLLERLAQQGYWLPRHLNSNPAPPPTDHTEPANGSGTNEIMGGLSRRGAESSGKDIERERQEHEKIQERDEEDPADDERLSGGAIGGHGELAHDTCQVS